MLYLKNYKLNQHSHDKCTLSFDFQEDKQSYAFI